MREADWRCDGRGACRPRGAHDGAHRPAPRTRGAFTLTLIGAVTGVHAELVAFTPTLLGGGWSHCLEDVRQALWATAPRHAVNVNTMDGGGRGEGRTTYCQRLLGMLRRCSMALWVSSGCDSRVSVCYMGGRGRCM